MLSRLPTIGLADKTNYNNIKAHLNPKKGTVLAFDSQRTAVNETYIDNRFWNIWDLFDSLTNLSILEFGTLVKSLKSVN